MKRCFSLLGLDENATKEQVLESYARKKSLYSGTVFDEDSQYAKDKLAELEQAVIEAYFLAEPKNYETAESDQLEALRHLLNEDEMHMQELYHKHLSRRFNRAIGVSSKRRSAAEQKADSAYKGNILLFWLGVFVVVVLIGMLLP